MIFKKGNRKQIETEDGQFQLISWEIDGEYCWCMTLRELCDFLGLNYRPKQMVVRVNDYNICKISPNEFSSNSIWGYDELFEGNCEYLLNVNGVKDFISRSKRKNTKNALNKIIKIMDIMDDRLF